MKNSLNSIIIAACLIFTAVTIIDGVAPVKYDINVGDTMYMRREALWTSR